MNLQRAWWSRKEFAPTAAIIQGLDPTEREPFMDRITQCWLKLKNFAICAPRILEHIEHMEKMLRWDREIIDANISILVNKIDIYASRTIVLNIEQDNLVTAIETIRGKIAVRRARIDAQRAQHLVEMNPLSQILEEKDERKFLSAFYTILTGSPEKSARLNRRLCARGNRRLTWRNIAEAIFKYITLPWLFDPKLLNHLTHLDRTRINQLQEDFDNNVQREINKAAPIISGIEIVTDALSDITNKIPPDIRNATQLTIEQGTLPIIGGAIWGGVRDNFKTRIAE